MSMPEWRDALLTNLMQGGPVCRHAAQYILDNDVEIGFARQSTGARWTLDGRIELNSKRHSVATSPANSWLMGIIVHEATHLEQGVSLALSVEGEVGGWKAEFLARAELGAPIQNPHWKAIVQVPDPPTDRDLRIARSRILQMTGHRYLIWLLPLRPNPLTFPAAGIGKIVSGRRKR